MAFKVTEEHDKNGGGFISEAGKGIHLTITNVEEKMSGINPQRVVTLVNDEGDRVTDRFMEHKPFTQKRLVWFLRACGVSVYAGSDCGVHLIDDSFVGKKLQADIQLDAPNDNGDVYPSITADGYHDYEKPGTREAPTAGKPATAPQIEDDEETF